jgi:hypothetical protein
MNQSNLRVLLLAFLSLWLFRRRRTVLELALILLGAGRIMRDFRRDGCRC